MEPWIIIPAYNEGHRIGPTLADFTATVTKKYGNAHMLVVSDSTDNTNKIVLGYASKNKKIQLIKNKVKRGKGFAILNGFKIACKESKNGSIIGFADADDAIEGSEIIKLIKALNDMSIDGVIASRYIKGSRNYGGLSVQGRLASRAYNLLLKILFGFKFNDTQCGAKFFRKRALEEVLDDLILPDVNFDLNLLYALKKANKTVHEIPIKFVNKGGSSMNMKLPLRSAQMLLIALGFRIVNSRFGFLLPSRIRQPLYSLIAQW